MSEDRPAVLPRWATTAAAEDVTSPSSGKLDAGWVAGEPPPHNHANFLQQNPSDWIRYMDEFMRSMAVLNWEQALGSGADGAFEQVGAGSLIDIRGADYDPISGYWLGAGNTDGCNLSQDDGRTFQPFGTGMASAVGLQDCAIGATSSAVAIGDSATMYQRATILSGSWGTVTAPGSPVLLSSIEYDTSNTRHVVVGEEAATEPYVATANNATGTAFTDRSAAVPAGFDGLGLKSLAVNTSGVVIACTSSAHTKLARSGDGGVTWAESTTTLVSGVYHVTWSPTLSRFIAVRIDSVAANNTYLSSDGLVWTSVFTGAIGFDGTPDDGDGHRLASLSGVIVVGGEFDGEPVIGVSFDAGVSWAVHRFFNGTGGDPRVIASRTGSKLLAFQDTFGLRCARVAVG